MARNKFWYIKERTNPQVGVKFYALGNISATTAKDASHALYGWNEIHKFETEAAYLNRCIELGIAPV